MSASEVADYTVGRCQGEVSVDAYVCHHHAFPSARPKLERYVSAVLTAHSANGAHIHLSGQRHQAPPAEAATSGDKQGTR